MMTAALAAAFVLGSASAGLAIGGSACLSCKVNDFAWQNRQDTARGNIIEQVDQLASSVSEESRLTNEALIAAIRTMTRQVSLAGEQEAKAARQAAQAVTQVYRDATVNRQINEARRRFGGEGQMIGACATNAMLNTVSLAMAARDERTAEIMASPALLASPGSGYTRQDGVAMRLRADSPQAVSPIAFLDPKTPAWAKDAFMNNLAALPPQSSPLSNPAAGPTAPGGSGTPGGGSSSSPTRIPLSPYAPGSIDDLYAQAEYRRRAALRDPAMVALSAVRAAGDSAPIHEHLGIDDDDDDAEGVTFLAALDKLIGEYGGGDAYQDWSSSLMGKSEHGLLAEIARLRAITAQLGGKGMEISARRQAIMAALIAGDAR